MIGNFLIPSLMIIISFIFGIDYLLSYKDRDNIGFIFLSIVSLIGTIVGLVTRIVVDSPYDERSLQSFLIDFTNWYIGCLVLYAILNIPYLIYLLIKKKEGKKRTIIKIIGLLLISFILVLLVSFKLYF